MHPRTLGAISRSGTFGIASTFLNGASRLRGVIEMETVSLDPQLPDGKLSTALSGGPRQHLLTAADRALLELGECLQEGGYRFTTVTPATHARVVSRPNKGRP